MKVREVLRKVMNLPISRWNFKADSTGQRHIGPMAQDFSPLFEVGPDNRHISVTDASGIASVAIQGLGKMIKAEDLQVEENLKARDAQIEKLQIHRRRDAKGAENSYFMVFPQLRGLSAEN